MSNSTAAYDPNLDHSDEGPMVIAIAVVFGSASMIAMALRLYTRVGVLRTAGWDDWTMLIATILSVGVSICTILEAKFALGKHIWDAMLDPVGMANQLKALYGAILMYNLAMNVVKISFLLQFRRIFRGEMVKRICLWFMVYVVIWAIVQDTLLGLSCLPIAYILPSMKDVCLDTLPVWYTSSAMNIVTDFSIFLIPIPFIAGLQLRQKQKLLVMGIFCLGFFTCVISIIRIFSLKSAVVTTDPTRDNVSAACWTVVELNCAILCSCLPTLKPLLGKFIPGLSSNKSNGYEMYASGTKSRNGGGTGVRGRQLTAHDVSPGGLGSSSHRTASSGSTEALKENAISYEYPEKVGSSAVAYAVHGDYNDERRAEEGSSRLSQLPIQGASPKNGIGGIVVTTEMRVENKGMGGF